MVMGRHGMAWSCYETAMVWHGQGVMDMVWQGHGNEHSWYGMVMVWHVQVMP